MIFRWNRQTLIIKKTVELQKGLPLEIKISKISIHHHIKLISIESRNKTLPESRSILRFLSKTKLVLVRNMT